MTGVEREELDRAAVEAFQARHRRLADTVERALMRLVVLGLVTLALAQMLGMGRFGLLAALEGAPVHEVSDWSRSLARMAGVP
ncbi:MAG: hypothetical protein LOD90_10100 [Symbiobacteriaceae bacterium]|nr:MAG: hypothetical protein DIU55_00120 [Bacillota bacterium]